MRTFSRAALAVAVCLVVTGCDGGGSSPGPTQANSRTGSNSVTKTGSSRPGGAEAPTSAASQDKCRIVSATALKAVVGGKLAAETAGLSGVGNPVCTFEFTRSTHQATRISLSANQSGTRAAFAKTKTRTKGAHTIPGLGDSAFFVAKTSTLQLLKGAKVVIIQATARAAGAPGPVTPIGRAVLVKVARAVLAQ